ncbi:hypothetical protein NESM_000246500 [Novymonas esmeraldas]|uniref:Uncharacterized protein n=1 Tax=Novymonas esmeraldas TaxID=1808958 RepID=A0AAW0F8J3_9TRYP
MQSISACAAALRDALEKGDVVELEQAITAAEDTAHAAPHARKAPSSSSLGSLITQAKDMYLVHMEACRPYLKPLRRACKELSERGIFEALVKARGAPDEVQLCMYTDLCNAESLRHEIVEAQRLALQLLDSTSAEDLDDFLNECSPFLEDRTILALVQKREDLLRAERRRALGAATTTPLRVGGSRGPAATGWLERSGRDPLEELGRVTVEDDGVPPLSSRAHRASTRDSATRHTPQRSESSEDRARSSSTAPSAYPALRDALDRAHDAGLQRAVAEGASPWMQGMRAVRHQVYEEVARDEGDARRQLEEAEMEVRADAYALEMVARARWWWSAPAPESTAPNGRSRSRTPPPPPPEKEVAPVRRPPPPGTEMPPPPALTRLPSPPARAAPQASHGGVAGAVHQSVSSHVYATHSLAAFALRPAGGRQPTPTRPPRGGAAAAAAAVADGAIVGGNAVRHRVADELHTPRALRDTPNISPIKDMSTASGRVSLSEQDHLYPRGNTRHMDSTAVASHPLDLSPPLELRRIHARLRGMLQEEDIHRRDIEGTEDFDRSVFLFPVSARIALLRRTEAQRVRRL